MPRKYTNIKIYKEEIFRLKEQGLSNREVAEKLGYELKQIRI